MGSSVQSVWSGACASRCVCGMGMGRRMNAATAAAAARPAAAQTTNATKGCMQGGVCMCGMECLGHGPMLGWAVSEGTRFNHAAQASVGSLRTGGRLWQLRLYRSVAAKSPRRASARGAGQQRRSPPARMRRLPRRGWQQGGLCVPPPTMLGRLGTQSEPPSRGPGLRV